MTNAAATAIRTTLTTPATVIWERSPVGRAVPARTRENRRESEQRRPDRPWASLFEIFCRAAVHRSHDARSPSTGCALSASTSGKADSASLTIRLRT